MPRKKNPVFETAKRIARKDEINRKAGRIMIVEAYRDALLLRARIDRAARFVEEHIDAPVTIQNLRYAQGEILELIETLMLDAGVPPEENRP